MSKKDLNNRQKQILKVVIDKHSIENKTVSSLSLQKTKELKNWSSATIRNDMSVLEEQGYLKKEHFSSGKVPTQKGYKLYIEALMDEYVGYKDIKNQLLNVFLTRNTSIDQILDECASLVANFLNLPTVLTTNQKIENETLKKIDLIYLEEKSRMIYLITSSGEVIRDFIYLDKSNEQKEQDLLATIRILNEHLYDCPLNKIVDKLDLIILKIRESIHSFEFIYEVIISKIILNKLKNSSLMGNKSIYNTKSLVHYDDMNVSATLELLDKYSIFDSINYNYLKTGKTLFNLEGDAEKGLAVATTDINLKIAMHKLIVVGPLRMNYSLVKSLLDFINEKVQELARE